MVKIYQVGGRIRDALLGVASKDIDYAVEAASWDEMREYIQSKGKIFLETPQYFTIRAHVDGLGDADFVLCRKDGEYRDGRRPETVEVGTLADDLARRDFTMNAIAQDMQTSALIDPYGGALDIQNKLIRCVGNPYDRFNEDALRMLRALRFAITKGFTIHETVEACFGDQHLVDKLDRFISWERKKDELYRMFKHDTFATIALFQRYPLLFKILFDASPLWLEPTLKER